MRGGELPTPMVKNANAVCLPRWLNALIFATAILGALQGCERKDSAAAESSPKSFAEFFEIRVGDKPVRLQIAVREEEMQKGLMERRDLGKDEGMLFVYNRPQRMSFWMRNTPTPLDIGFFDQAGKLLEIYPLHPFDETAVGSKNTQLLMALEMNQGWFRENGVKPGAQIDLKAVSEALEIRGFKADQFHIREQHTP